MSLGKRFCLVLFRFSVAPSARSGVGSCTESHAASQPSAELLAPEASQGSSPLARVYVMNFNALLVEILGKRVVNLVHGYLGHRRGERPSTGRIRAPPALSLRTEATSVLTPTRQVISTAERFTIKPRMKRAMVARGAASAVWLPVAFSPEYRCFEKLIQKDQPHIVPFNASVKPVKRHAARHE